MGSQLALDLRESPLKGFCEYCGKTVFQGSGAVNVAGETLCIRCGAWAEVIDLVNTQPGMFGVTALYFIQEPYEGSLIGMAQNFTQALTMPVTHVTKWERGGFGSQRRTVYFTGPMGSWWSGNEFNGNAGNLLRNLRRLTKGKRR